MILRELCDSGVHNVVVVLPSCRANGGMACLLVGSHRLFGSVLYPGWLAVQRTWFGTSHIGEGEGGGGLSVGSGLYRNVKDDADGKCTSHHFRILFVY